MALKVVAETVVLEVEALKVFLEEVLEVVVVEAALTVAIYAELISLLNMVLEAVVLEASVKAVLAALTASLAEILE